MKGGLPGAALLVAITVALSGCGGSHRLPAPLLKLIHSYSKDRNLTGKTVAVYGPGSRSALEQADSGGVVGETTAERNGCYLVVLQGHFEQGMAPGPGPLPHYTIETNLWTPDSGITDTGLADRLPAAVSRLRGFTLVALER
jgi:hypothetical protein